MDRLAFNAARLEGRQRIARYWAAYFSGTTSGQGIDLSL
jgi:hypothetical protein